MAEIKFQSFLILVAFAAAGVVFAALFRISAPYGRYNRPGWGPALPDTLGWMVMEFPAAALFAVYFLTGTAPKNLPLILFFAMWEIHYLHRALIYPVFIRAGGKQMPVSVVLMGLLFNVANTYLNGRYLFSLSGGYSLSWLADPRFWVGGILFFTGFATNRWADRRLRELRKPGEAGYQIPDSGLFRMVSCPNYLGEIIEWTGWAVATWSLPGLAFAVWTVANLAPRARSHHAWYQSTFMDYPAERKALIPWFW